MISTAKSRTWSATYLLPYSASPTAIPDKKAKGYFRHTEIVTATSSREVVADIVARQALPIEVREIKPANPLFGGRIKKDFRQQFMLSLIFSVEGGMSPGRALEQAIESESGPMRQRLNVGLNALRQGRSFLEALRTIDMFDASTMAIIEAGEETGKLRQALSTAEAHLLRGNAAMKTIIGAITWTSIDLFFAVTAILSTRMGLIPYLREQNSGKDKDSVAMNAALDFATSANDFLIVTTVLAMIALLAGAWGYFSKSDEFRSKIDSMLLRTPVVRDLMTNTAISATCGVMSSLLSGGVNFIPATQIAERGTRMVHVIRYWQIARGRVEIGESPAAAIAMVPFSANEQMILRSHRDSEQLSRAYLIIGKQRDEKARAASVRFAKVAFLSTLLYSSLGVVLALYVVYLQNQSTMNLSFGVG